MPDPLNLWFLKLFKPGGLWCFSVLALVEGGGRKREALGAGPSERASQGESEPRREVERGREGKSVWELERQKVRGRTRETERYKEERMGGIEKQKVRRERQEMRERVGQMLEQQPHHHHVRFVYTFIKTGATPPPPRRPHAHCLADADPAADVVPAGQSLGLADPTGQNRLAGHCAGADAPLGQYDPAGHSTDDAAVGQ